MALFDIVVVGSFNTDLSLFTDVIPSAGETVIGSKFLLGYGGKGANQAVAAKFLGAQVRLMAKLGRDTFGKSSQEYLHSIGVNIDCISHTSHASTGVALITVERGVGENRIIVVPGANNFLSNSDLDHAVSSGLLSSRVLVCQFEIPASTTLHALELAKREGITTILNPAPMSQSCGSESNLIQTMLPLCDYCCPNEVEAVALTSHCKLNPPREDDECDEALPRAIVACLLCMSGAGVKFPIVTLGSQGVAALIDDSQTPVELPADVSIFRCFDSSSIIRLAAPHISEVVDTTGAGDCFVGALAYFVSRHPELGPIEHLRRAVWVASQSVKKPGTQSSFPKAEDLPSSLFKPGTFVWPD